jgi:DNA polymerase/3'-5' exonuclease PolX
MSTNARRPLAQALDIIAEFEKLIDTAATCDRWEVAGSVRRRRTDVGDVDIVAIPRTGPVDVSDGMFPEIKTVNLLWHTLDAMLAAGKIAKAIKQTTLGPRTRWGDCCRAVAFKGMDIEIQCADADNWGGWMAVRTGPDPLPKLLVIGIEKNGYSCRGGFHLHDRKGKLVEKCTEQQFFDAARISMKVPHQR